MSNQMYFKILIVSWLVIGLTLFSSATVFAMGETPHSPAKTLDFTLKDMEGNSHTLSAYRGRIVFLNFWASWCPPCREEMPSMQKTYTSWDKNKYVMLAVNVDEGREKIKEFARKNGYTFPILIDNGSGVSKKYGIRGIPTTYLIDGKGRMITKVVGSRDWSLEEIQRIIKK